MNTQLSAHQFKDVYEWLGINLSKLGCLMLDTEPIKTEYFEIMQDGITAYFPGYQAVNKERFWIDGYVGDKPHLTLLYGFMVEAKQLKNHIEKVLGGWNMETITIADVGYFDSPYPDEQYYCIVAHIKVTDILLEGHRRLEFLPHINTFTGYKPHVTIAYIVKDDAVRDRLITHLKSELVGKELKINGLNYGGNK